MKVKRARRWCRTLAGAVAGVLALTACGGNAGSRTKVLAFGDSFSASHPVGSGGVQPFLEYLREYGPGVGLEIEYFPNGQIGKQQDMLNLIRNDVVQIAPVIPAYLANEIPLSSVGELPGMVDDSCEGANTLTPLMQEGGILYEEELQPRSARALWSVYLTGYEVITKDTPIETPTDLSGELVRSPGGMGDRTLHSLGAAPVTIAAPDLYEAVSRGTVSGAMLPALSVAQYSLEEVLGYATRGANFSSTTITYAINDETWASLTDEQKDVFTAASAIAQERGCSAVMDAASSAADSIAAAGVEVIEISDDLEQVWDTEMEPIQSGWIRDLEESGRPAQEVVDTFENAKADLP